MRRFLSLAFAAAFAFACGDSGARQRVDAGQAIDAAPDLDLVTVRVVARGQPVAGIPIIFHGVDGLVLETAVSGGAGGAEFSLPAGGMVTIAAPDGPLKTFAGVEAGDSLVLDIDSTVTSKGTATISLPGGFMTATTFRITTGCSAIDTADPSGPVSLAIDSSCVGSDETISAIAVAIDDSDGGFIVQGITGIRDRPLAAGGATFSLPAWAPITDTFAVTLALPNPLTAIALGEVVAGSVYQRQVLVATNPLTIPTLPALADGFQFSVGFTKAPLALPTGTLERSQLDVVRLPATTTQLSYDTGTDGLASLDSMSLAVGSPARPAVGFASAQTSADVWQATIAWGAPVEQSWDLLAAPEAAVVTYPELPAFLAERWAPPSAEAVIAGALLAEISDLDGYDTVRTGPGFSVFSPETPPLETPSSSLRVSAGLFRPAP